MKGTLRRLFRLPTILGDVLRFPKQGRMEANSFDDGRMLRKQEFGLVFSSCHEGEIAFFATVIKHASEGRRGASQHRGGFWPIVRL